jgi:hypothetical protein
MSKISSGKRGKLNFKDSTLPNLSWLCSLISHFTIASDGREYLRVKSVDLKSGEEAGVEVEQAGRSGKSTVSSLIMMTVNKADKWKIVAPTQHLSCLFKLRHKESDRSKGEFRDTLLRFGALKLNIWSFWKCTQTRHWVLQYRRGFVRSLAQSIIVRRIEADSIRGRLALKESHFPGLEKYPKTAQEQR